MCFGSSTAFHTRLRDLGQVTSLNLVSLSFLLCKMGQQEQEVRSYPYPDELLVPAHICLFHLSVGAGWLMEGLVRAVQGPELWPPPLPAALNTREATLTLMALPP